MNMKKSLISMLVLLMTAVTGAWAQTETPLITILNTGNTSFTSGSKTFDDKVTVTFSGEVQNGDGKWGWLSMPKEERTLTVTAAEGYTITRVKFYTDEGSAFDEEAPFEAILAWDNDAFTKVNDTSIGRFGVTKIEVYGSFTVNHSANNTWAIPEMLDGYVELEMEYFNITAPTANTADIYIGSTTPLINAGSTTEVGATMKYLVTATNEQPTSTDGFSADVPTAQAITAQGTYYVWYYLDLALGDDSDISALAVEVTVSVLTYDVTMKEGTGDADNWEITPAEATTTGVVAGTAVSVKYNGTKKVKSVKAKKKVKPAAEATAKDKGKLICADGHIHAYGADAECTADRVAKIVYVGTTGHATYNHGLALALTDEGQMNWTYANPACYNKNTSTPVTGATWLLASKDQWDNMIYAAGGYTALRDGSNLGWGGYWSGTEDGWNAWFYHFGEHNWYVDSKYRDYIWVRACLAF